MDDVAGADGSPDVMTAVVIGELKVMTRQTLDVIQELKGLITGMDDRLRKVETDQALLNARIEAVEKGVERHDNLETDRSKSRKLQTVVPVVSGILGIVGTLGTWFILFLAYKSGVR